MKNQIHKFQPRKRLVPKWYQTWYPRERVVQKWYSTRFELGKPSNCYKVFTIQGYQCTSTLLKAFLTYVKVVSGSGMPTKSILSHGHVMRITGHFRACQMNGEWG